MHSGVNAGIHLCVACAWRGQSVASHKLPVLIFFKALSPDGVRSHQFSYTGWPGSPRWSCLLPPSYPCGVANDTFFFYVGAGDQTSSLLSKLFPLSHLISPPCSSFVRDVSSFITFLSGCISPEQFTELSVLLSYLDDGNNDSFSWQQTG